jgi:hypothetical protein
MAMLVTDWRGLPRGQFLLSGLDQFEPVRIKNISNLKSLLYVLSELVEDCVRQFKRL